MFRQSSHLGDRPYILCRSAKARIEFTCMPTVDDVLDVVSRFDNPKLRPEYSFARERPT